MKCSMTSDQKRLCHPDLVLARNSQAVIKLLQISIASYHRQVHIAGRRRWGGGGGGGGGDECNLFM